jgi:hypothetical protein
MALRPGQQAVAVVVADDLLFLADRSAPTPMRQGTHDETM